MDELLAAVEVTMNQLSYRKRPWHAVQCASPGCGRFGFRTDVCPRCNEYHCEEHVDLAVQGSEIDHDEYSATTGPDGERCFLCANGGRGHLSEATEESGVDRSVDELLAELKEALKDGRHRESFVSLMLDAWKRDLRALDESDESPLERKMWAGMLVRSLDRYYDPQVEIYDTGGTYVVRADFASTMLRIAVFADGERYHSKPADLARDAAQDAKLGAMRWRVLRFRTKRITEEFPSVLEEVYDATAARVHELHRAVGWVTS